MLHFTFSCRFKFSAFMAKLISWPHWYDSGSSVVHFYFYRLLPRWFEWGSSAAQTSTVALLLVSHCRLRPSAIHSAATTVSQKRVPDLVRILLKNSSRCSFSWNVVLFLHRRMCNQMHTCSCSLCACLRSQTVSSPKAKTSFIIYLFFLMSISPATNM